MRKFLAIRLVVATALTAFSAGAFAQSTTTAVTPAIPEMNLAALNALVLQLPVTLYGVLDAGLIYQSTSGPAYLTSANETKNAGSVFGYKDGGIYSSNFGIKGAEQLGNGYDIHFKLQAAFNTGSGNVGLNGGTGSALFNQYAMLGVTSPYGTLDGGRQIVPMIWAMADTDVRRSQYFGSILTAWVGLDQAAGWVPTSTNAPIGALYDDNAIVYQTPRIDHVTLGLEYAPGGVAGQFQNGTRVSAVLRYAGDNLHLAAVVYNGYNTNPAYPAPIDTAKEKNNNRFYYLGARYTIQKFDVSASYSLAQNPAKFGRPDNLDLLSAGLGYQLTTRLNVTSGLYYIHSRSSAEPGHSTEISLGATYVLTKQALLYAQIGHVANSGIMNQMISYGQFVAPNTSTTTVMTGLRFSFSL